MNNSTVVKEQRQEENFNESAFERAFDAAKIDSESASKDIGYAFDVEQPKFDMNHACTEPGDITGEYDFDNADLFDATQQILETTKNEAAHPQDWSNGEANAHESLSVTNDGPRIGSDTIPAHSSQEEMMADVEADELARTAGHLLDNLRHEQSQKFQQSNFLELMRQLRDKEVMVEGDKISVSFSYLL